MGKNTKVKTPPVEAPVVDKKPEEKKAPAKVDVLQMADLEKIKQSYAKNGGLDANHRVDVLMGIKTYFKDDPNAASNTGVPQEAIDKINGIAAIGFVAALGDEILMGTSGWAAKMRLTQIEAINSVNALTGISVDVKALPAPDKDGNILVEKKNIKVATETKKKLEAEQKVNKEAESKEYMNNPTLIENDDQLREALGFQLVNAKVARPVERLLTTANFYRSYLTIKANKSENKDAEIARVKALTDAELLQEISTMVPPTFTAEGFGKYLCKLAKDSKSIIPAFNLFKRAATNKETGVCKLSDEEAASLVRVLVVWNATSQISTISSSIEDHNNNIKLLSKNAEANAKGIEKENEAIAECNDMIKMFQDIITMTTEPDFSLADNFIAAYKDSEHPYHNAAVIAYGSIMKTNYEGVEIPELEMDTALLNVQQRVGIVLNLFAPALVKHEAYSIDNLIALSTEEEGNKKEEKSEGESKNS